MALAPALQATHCRSSGERQDPSDEQQGNARCAQKSKAAGRVREHAVGPAANRTSKLQKCIMTANRAMCWHPAATSIKPRADLDDGALVDAGAQPHDGVGDSALLQVGPVADDGIVDLALHDLGRRQEARAGVDGRLRVVELEARRLRARTGKQGGSSAAAVVGACWPSTTCMRTMHLAHGKRTERNSLNPVCLLPVMSCAGWSLGKGAES